MLIQRLLDFWWITWNECFWPNKSLKTTFELKINCSIWSYQDNIIDDLNTSYSVHQTFSDHGNLRICKICIILNQIFYQTPHYNLYFLDVYMSFRTKLSFWIKWWNWWYLTLLSQHISCIHCHWNKSFLKLITFSHVTSHQAVDNHVTSFKVWNDEEGSLK